MTLHRVLLLTLLGCSTALGQMPKEVVPLWQAEAPGAKGKEAVDVPGLWIYPVEDKSKRPTVVVICPGGGYRIHAVDHEGHQIAKFFNRQGITAVVLRYRLGPKYRHPAPLQDAQRAVRYVRSKAKEWGVSKDRVGIMGFSAGGHLASTLATHFDSGNAGASDPIERESCRPDFAVLGYAVVSFTADFSHRGSGRNLLGPEPDEELMKNLSNETQVTKDTPPTFLFHTYEDTAVPPDNAIVFFQACKKAGVPAELHIFQDGPHGVGWANGHPTVGKWQTRLHEWMKSSGLLVMSDRTMVKGTVMLDGEPIPWGSIAFVPEDANAPTAWAPVRRGKFEIPVHRGAVFGKNRVELYDLGDVKPGPTTEDAQQIDGGKLSAVVTKNQTEFQFEATRN
ncbi:MAG: alpha/beta hydrolase [Planctomycetaceae bacterium]